MVAKLSSDAIFTECTTTIQKIVVATIHHTDHFFRLGA